MDLYTPVHARLCRYVQTLVWDSEEAKDLLGEITLKAYERFDTVKDKDQFMFFLFGIARNLFLKKLRKQKFSATWKEDLMTEVDATQNAEERIHKLELVALLNRLPAQQQEAITLFEVSGFSYEEISKIQDCSLSQVKATIYKARVALKAFIIDENKRLNYQQEITMNNRLKMDDML